MKLLPFALTLGLALALTVAQAAEHCTVEPEVATPETGVSFASFWYGDEGTGKYYVDNDPCQPNCVVSVWLYEETNGIPGLQRDDDVSGGDSTGSCWPSDRIIL